MCPFVFGPLKGRCREPTTWAITLISISGVAFLERVFDVDRGIFVEDRVRCEHRLACRRFSHRVQLEVNF